MKKITALLMAAMMLLAFAGCTNQANPPQSQPQTTVPDTATPTAAPAAAVPNVKISLIAGFTGSFATYSQYEKRAAELMQKYINDKGGISSLGGAKIEFSYADHMSDPSQVATIFERAVEDKDVVAVLSNNSSSMTSGMLASMEKAKIPLLTINSATKIVEQGYSYIFQTVFAASEVGAAQVNFLSHLQQTEGIDTSKIGILFQDNDAGRDGGDASKVLAEAAGMQVVAFEAYPVGSPDMSSPVVNLINSGAEAVFLTGDINDLKQVMATMKQYEYSPLIIGGGAGFLIQEFAEALGDDAIGVCTAATYAYNAKHVTEDPTLSEITNLFHDTYGQYPSSYEMGVISQTLMIWEALEKTGKADRTVIRDYMKDNKFTTYAAGSPLQVSDTGASPDHKAMICQWQKLDSGEIVLSGIWPTEYATQQLVK